MTDDPIPWPGGERASVHGLGDGLSKAAKPCVPHAENSKVFITLQPSPEARENPQEPAISVLTKGAECVEAPQASLSQDIKSPTLREHWGKCWRLQKGFPDFNHFRKSHTSPMKKIQIRRC